MKPAGQAPLDIMVTAVHHVVERMPDPEWTLAPFVVPRHFVIGLALDGRAEYTIDSRKYEIKKGDVVFFTGDQDRLAASVPEDPWRFITVSFDLAFGDEETKHFMDEFPNVLNGVPDKIIRLGQELNQVWSGRRTGYLLKSRSLLQDILYLLILYQDAIHYKPGHYREICMVQQYIQDHYNRNFSISELAGMANFSESYFRKLFRSVTGMTSVQYTNMVKISKAKDIISSGEANVSEAALQTGFQDIYYFSRLFKAVTGESPSSFRRKANGETAAKDRGEGQGFYEENS